LQAPNNLEDRLPIQRPPWPRKLLYSCLAAPPCPANNWHKARKELTHMSIALRNKQIIALFILALVTVLVLATIVFSAVTHVNIWHAIISSGLIPAAQYGHG
jgi:hypothetical protein